MEPKPLEIDNLELSFTTPYGEVQAVRGVSLTLEPGEILVLAGESGCGKSVLCKSVLKLLPRYARIKSGSIRLCGRDITHASEAEMTKIRGTEAAMVFQNPLTTLMPSMTIGAQIREALRRRHLTPEEEEAESIRLLESVGITEARQRLSQLPLAFSGGMRQRCALAIALAAQPKVLLADEPTTALDGTIQIQILDRLKKLRDERGLSILLVTHDLGVAAHIADRVGILYAGRLVEIGTAEEIFYDPRHPYTWGLLSSLPAAARGKRLTPIDGMPPDLLAPPQGDAFASRNPYALAIDYEKQPPLFDVSSTHKAATWLLDPRAPKITPPESARIEPFDSTKS